MGHMLILQDRLEERQDLAIHGAVIVISSFLQLSFEGCGKADLEIANLHQYLRVGYK